MSIYNVVICSCIACKTHISVSHLSTHHNSKRCYNKQQKLTKCKYCDFSFYGLSSSIIRNHLRWCENNPKQIERKLNIKIKSCAECGANYSSRSSYCSIECRNIQRTKESYRNKLSLSRKKYLKANPDKHPWKNNNKFKSVPCETVKSLITSLGYSFVEEYQPLSDRLFSIDIAFPDLKIGIEVNGNQHYNSDGTLKEYYQQRHDLIETAGWKLIELHYTSAFNKELIVDILKFNDYYVQPDYTKYLKKKNNLDLAKPKLRKLEKWNPYIEIIKNSDINFSKFGWVKQVSLIINLSPQKVNLWMKRYMSEFYETNCFKRKTQK